jgi:hypothetical protein
MFSVPETLPEFKTPAAAPDSLFSAIFCLLAA